MLKKSLLQSFSPDLLAEAATLSKRTTQKTTDESIGERLARVRRERGITQAEIAERLGLSQGSVSHYERGELRLNGPLIIELTGILGVSADELLGLESAKPTKRVRNRRLQRQLQELEKLSKRDQQVVARMLDGFLQGRLAS